MGTNFIPCAVWVKRGVAKSNPEVIQLSRQELKGFVAKAKTELLGTKGISGKTKDFDDEAVHQETPSNKDDLNMEDYDNEDDNDSVLGLGNMINMDEIDEDSNEEMEDEEDSDKEDEEIKPEDNLIAVGHFFGDVSILEIYVYNEECNDLYIHHDIVLPTVPLSFEWLGQLPSNSESSNLLAIGGVSPTITIWDLDVVNSLEPIVKLGEFSEKKKYQHRNQGHRDAVLDLVWNGSLPHILASGSVDRSVLLWDLGKAKAVTQFTNFQDKVQSLDWHPSEANILLAGACDRTVKLFDCRISEALHSLQVDGEVEKVMWHPGNLFNFLVGTNKGVMCCVDCRTSKVVWSVEAHSQEITGLCINVDQDWIVTASTDETIKVWDKTEDPQLLYTKYSTHGQLHCMQACPENPNIVCVGGNKKDNIFKVYDLSADIQHQNYQDGS